MLNNITSYNQLKQYILRSRLTYNTTSICKLYNRFVNKQLINGHIQYSTISQLSNNQHQSIRLFSTELSKRLKRQAELNKQRNSNTNPLNVNICIIGRPNVGKSTLFNRLVGKNYAIVNEIAGVTRDRHERIGNLFDLQYNVIDTAGLDTIHDITHHYLKTNKQLLYNDIDDADNTKTANLAHNKPLDKQLQHDILQQTEYAIRKSQIILFVIDGRDGLTERDKQFAQWLRRYLNPDKTKQYVLTIVNKAEIQPNTIDRLQLCVDECYSLGFNDKPIAISAQHNENFDDLYNALTNVYKQLFTEEQLQLQAKQFNNDNNDNDNTNNDNNNNNNDDINEPKYVRIAIVGRPNVGKSSLVNAILHESRCVVGNQPGITRDSQSILWQDNNDIHTIELIDTAGLKGTSVYQHSRFSKVDSLAMQHSISSIDMCNIACLVVDASNVNHSDVIINRVLDYNNNNDIQLIHSLVRNVLTSDDISIAQHILSQGRSLIIIANKIDLVQKSYRQHVLYGLSNIIQTSIPEAKQCIILPTSAITQYNITQIRNNILLQYDRWNKRINTSRLNNWLHDIQCNKPHPLVSNKRIKLKYITQIHSRPPTFVIWVNRANCINNDYQRMLCNSIRNTFDMHGVPIRITLRQTDNPYNNNNNNKSKNKNKDKNKQRNSDSNKVTTINAEQLLNRNNNKNNNNTYMTA